MTTRRSLWRSAARWPRTALPDHWRAWLLDDASLTQRVAAACTASVNVELLNQGWARPIGNEATLLKIKTGRRVLVRQVHLVCRKVPWVYARTLIPRQTLCGAERRLAYLGDRSLGAVLFSDPSMQRESLELARLAPGEALYEMATAALARKPKEVWGRHAVFRLHGKPLLVSEIFLPALVSFPE